MALRLTIPLLALAVLSGCTGSPWPDGSAVDAGGSRLTLFHITKSENANYVVYDLILDRDGRIAAEPLDVYWVMAETDGSRAGLNFAEQPVYGVEVESVDAGAGRVEFKINGVEGRPMDAALASGGGDAAVSTTIAGERARLTSVFLGIRKTWNPFSPDVEVHLSGVALDGDGKPLRETLRRP